METLRITAATGGKRVVEALVDEARGQYEAAVRERTVVYSVDQDGYWAQVGSRPMRPLTTVVLPHNQAKAVLEDCREFLASEQWYSHHGIPYRRGYLLYGPPGTGKTSLVTALAGELQLDVYVVTLSSPSMTDEMLRSLLNSAGPRSILLLEDVDAAFVGRAAGDEQAGRLTFSGLLNAVDGVAAQEGRLLFMTTNHLDRLSSALIRPGRIDVRVQFALATEPQIRSLFVSFYQDLPPTHGPPTSAPGVLPVSVPLAAPSCTEAPLAPDTAGPSVDGHVSTVLPAAEPLQPAAVSSMGGYSGRDDAGRSNGNSSSSSGSSGGSSNGGTTTTTSGSSTAPCLQSPPASATAPVAAPVPPLPSGGSPLAGGGLGGPAHWGTSSTDPARQAAHPPLPPPGVYDADESPQLPAGTGRLRHDGDQCYEDAGTGTPPHDGDQCYEDAGTGTPPHDGDQCYEDAAAQGAASMSNRLAELADKFAAAVPEGVVSMAQLQGYLMAHKFDPLGAVSNAHTLLGDGSAGGVVGGGIGSGSGGSGVGVAGPPAAK